ncbi:MAG: cupin domain-containing protein [Bacteroidota bacterium]|nr:cupin domain-containing protein [Bacteroidota bacterium]MDP4225977.1 cupin domain-containing protein [Bacteroidota bacterium]MDP4274751.1 cupin domain-containing protein [Bacteroidota bacterium]
MPVHYRNSTPKKVLAEGITRRIAYTDHLLSAVLEYTNGPMAQPDPPHSHPHEQVSYVAQGELYVFIGDEKYHLHTGDQFSVPPDVPHTIQNLGTNLILVDNFTPVRKDFIE